MTEMTQLDGEYIVRLARRAIEHFLATGGRIERPSDAPMLMHEKSGVFVTLTEHDELRGCIGYSTPVKSLLDGLIDVAISAATEDPRFKPVRQDEFDQLKVEVSVLTPLELLTVRTPKEYPSKIQVGRDGLIIETEAGAGLLLPQVAVDCGWDAADFLTETCVKTGVMPDAWLERRTRIYKFSSIIFGEVVPKGQVTRKFLVTH